ncbi:hypothetical protein ATKI12_8592 [Kitasatospora sp. Ki12]|nr:hypothetical protein [Kitasatospora xanthocidica]GHF81932.1 hypothetical protein GCM10018790_69520 [Kitasatospora xanthocidica]
MSAAPRSVTATGLLVAAGPLSAVGERVKTLGTPDRDDWTAF